MTIALSGKEVARRVAEQIADSVVDSDDTSIIIRSNNIFQVAQFLKTTPEFDFSYLTSVTSVDYIDFIEVVYRLTSIKHNHGLVLKTRCYDRDNPTVPSVVSLWRGADLQEREVYDLMGISFSDHPNLRRLLLWEGFQGHPLRRDYL